MDFTQAIWLVTLVSLLACALSGSIAARSATAAGLPGCRSDSGCAVIASSRWARWGPIPVSIAGTVVYLSIGVLSGLIALGYPQNWLMPVPELVLTLALAAAGAGIWFVLLQLTVIKRGCMYCNLVHLLGWIMLATLLIADKKASGITMQRPGSTAAVALTVLIIGQTFWRPRSYAIQEVTPGTSSKMQKSENHFTAEVEPTSPVQMADPSPVTATPTVSRMISLLGGRIHFNASDWPIVGSIEAEHLIALLFDYTCSTCRRLHQIVNEAVETPRGRLGVILLPVPMHPACNPTVTKQFPGRGYACQYSRLAIAVWQARPDQFEAFDRYMFSEVEPPPLGLAIARAEQLTGVRINPHQPDPGQDCVIRRAIKIYQAAELQQIPSLLFPRARMSGEVKSLLEFQVILKHQLRL
jgi:uncharacterized membrane protein